MGDVLDAPRARAEGEQVADAGLVDHLLVELADPRPGPSPVARKTAYSPRSGIVPPEGDGEALGAAAAGEGVGEAVPRDAGAQLRRTRRWGSGRRACRARTRGRPGERGVGGRAPGEGQRRRRPSTRRGRTSRRPAGRGRRGVGGDAQRLDLAGEHALDDDGGLHEVAAELREEHTPADRPDLVAGTAHALQAGGDRGRRLDLHHEVDGPHVDAELEAARGDDAGRRPLFRSSSMVARCSLLTEPWWARASTAGAPLEAPDWAMTWAGGRVSAAARGTASGPHRRRARRCAPPRSR